MASLTIHTDGGSRGNPGPAACAFVAERGAEVVYKASKFLGVTTNNVAEYNGVLLALHWIIENNISAESISFILDSELVVKQINGLYKVRDEKIALLFKNVKEFLAEVNGVVTFKSVPRNQNKIADLLLNEELDRNT
jgi:ribonuclease HI